MADISFPYDVFDPTIASGIEIFRITCWRHFFSVRNASEDIGTKSPGNSGITGGLSSKQYSNTYHAKNSAGALSVRSKPLGSVAKHLFAVSYTHLTLPTSNGV